MLSLQQDWWHEVNALAGKLFFRDCASAQKILRAWAEVHPSGGCFGVGQNKDLLRDYLQACSDIWQQATAMSAQNQERFGDRLRDALFV